MALKIGSNTKVILTFTPTTIEELKNKIAQTKQDGKIWAYDLSLLEITEIEDWLFDGCTGLQSIDLPINLIKIGKGAFSGCTRLISVQIPKNVIKIGCGAFKGCKKLKDVTLPLGANAVLDCVFEDCDALKTIHVNR